MLETFETLSVWAFAVGLVAPGAFFVELTAGLDAGLGAGLLEEVRATVLISCSLVLVCNQSRLTSSSPGPRVVNVV